MEVPSLKLSPLWRCPKRGGNRLSSFRGAVRTVQLRSDAGHRQNGYALVCSLRLLRKVSSAI